MRPLSIWDRIVFGAIAGVVGAILGLIAALLLAIGLHARPAFGPVVAFSAAYFFCIGARRGADAGFIVGEAFSAIAMLGAAEAGATSVREEAHDKPRAWRSVGLLVAWFVVAGVLAWRA